MQTKSGLTVDHTTQAVSSRTDKLRLVMAGKEYFDLLVQLINEATGTIHLQTYIFNDDETGILVTDALKRAAKRKVKVYVVVDGYASQALSSAFAREMREAGIRFKKFEPFLKSKYLYFGRRLHHKLFVADARHALVGGINIANRYNDGFDQPAWLDFALYVFGETANRLRVICEKGWNELSDPPLLSPFRKAKSTVLPVEQKITVRRNDWVTGKTEVSKTYQHMLRTAQSEIMILCSYFLPGRMIRKSIVQAIHRGVKVKIIAAGTSDVMLAKHAERWLYDWLLRNGVKLYEYQHNVLHGKIAVCDDLWMAIGSYNINDISAYASIELNLDVYDPEFTKDVRQKLELILQQDCIPITREYHIRTTNLFIQLKRWFSYQLIRAVFHLFTFYFKNRG